jgi:hypothetical protein
MFMGCFWILDVGYWMLGVGCWVLDRCWLDVVKNVGGWGFSFFGIVFRKRVKK